MTTWKYDGSGARIYQLRNLSQFDYEITWVRDHAGRVIGRFERGVDVPEWFRDYRFEYDQDGRVLEGEFLDSELPTERWPIPLRLLRGRPRACAA